MKDIVRLFSEFVSSLSFWQVRNIQKRIRQLDECVSTLCEFQAQLECRLRFPEVRDDEKEATLRIVRGVSDLVAFAEVARINWRASTILVKSGIRTEDVMAHAELVQAHFAEALASFQASTPHGGRASWMLPTAN